MAVPSGKPSRLILPTCQNDHFESLQRGGW
jgi:hypothetical protein